MTGKPVNIENRLGKMTGKIICKTGRVTDKMPEKMLKLNRQIPNLHLGQVLKQLVRNICKTRMFQINLLHKIAETKEPVYEICLLISDRFLVINKRKSIISILMTSLLNSFYLSCLNF